MYQRGTKISCLFSGSAARVEPQAGSHQDAVQQGGENGAAQDRQQGAAKSNLRRRVPSLPASAALLRVNVPLPCLSPRGDPEVPGPDPPPGEGRVRRDAFGEGGEGDGALRSAGEPRGPDRRALLG